VAITVFAGADGETQRLGHDLASVITNDLGRCGLFRPVDPAAFIGPIGDVPNFANWKAIGAQALVTGRVESLGGGQLRVEFRLWDVLPGTQIQGTAFKGDLANWRRIAHLIADVIYERLLGEKGYFDTAWSTSAPPARVTAASSASPSWTRTARTTASSPMARGWR